MEQSKVLILVEPELFLDDTQKLINVYNHLIQTTFENPNTLVIFKLNAYEP